MRFLLTWQPKGAFHHVGFVVASIQNSVQGFASMLRADWDKQVIHDLNQKVRVTFLTTHRAGDPLWELVEPADENRPCNRSLPKAAACTMFVISWTIWTRHSPKRARWERWSRGPPCRQSRSEAGALPGSTPNTVC